MISKKIHNNKRYMRVYPKYSRYLCWGYN